MLKSNLEWEKWGEIDPLFGVASWSNKSKDGKEPWTDEEFYTMGESDWNDFVKFWEEYGLNNHSCLEIGCGAGRITKSMSNYFKSVEAIDVSKGMIEYAQKLKLPNVRFSVSNGITIPLNDNSIHNVFSCHVFQHFDSLEVAKEIFNEIHRVLLINGTLMIHLPIFNWPQYPKLFSKIYKLIKIIGQIRANLKRKLMKFNLSKPIMRGLYYDYNFIFSALPKIGFKDIRIVIFTVRSNNAIHPFIFARKC